MLQNFLPHKVKKEADDNEQRGDAKEILFRVEQLPPEVQKNLPALVNHLESDFFAEWEQIKDHFVLFKIEDFAGRLQQCAIRYGVKHLEAYADRLLEAIEALDLEALKKEMQDFPDLLKSLKASKLNKL